MGNDNDKLDNQDSFEPDFFLEESDTEFGKCPQCQAETFDLEPISDFTRLALTESGVENKFDSVCSECTINLNEQISHAGRIKAEQKQKLNKLLNKWNSKIETLRTGRSLMSQKIYPEAQRHYEEYVQILEAVFNKGEEGLSPLMISKEHRRHESTILCHLLWDLVFIYDQFEPGTAKLQYTCDKLYEFLPFARGKSAVVSNIRKHSKKAKHPTIIQNLFTKSKNIKGGCFIATAVFDDPNSIELSVLRNFRDHYLKKTRLGRNFIYYYYKYSPPFANKIKNIFFFKAPIKFCLTIISYLLIKLNF